MPPLPWTGSTIDGRDWSDPGRRVLEHMADEGQSLPAGVLTRSEGPAIGIGVGQELRSRLDAGLGPHRGLAVEAQDRARPPEVAAREGDDLAPAGQRPGELQGRVDGVGTAHPEQGAIETRRRDPDERLLECDPGLADGRRRHVADSSGLVAGWPPRHRGGRARWCAAAKLPARSMNRLPSGSTKVAPDALSTTSGASSPPVRGPAPSMARIRSMTRWACGPG